MSLLHRVVERLRRLDADVAHEALRTFEARHGLDLRGLRVAVADLSTAARLLRPEGRPLVEHHWATWCAPCLEELDRMERLARALEGRADLVAVSWDRFQAEPGTPMDVTFATVSATVAEHRLSFPNLVLDAEPEAAFDALRPASRTVPHTRVLDADGGVLKVFDGPLDDADIGAIIAVVEA